MEHQKVLKALGKGCWVWDRVLGRGRILQGRDMVLVVPRLLVGQCPTAQAVLPRVLGEEVWDTALGMAY